MGGGPEEADALEEAQEERRVAQRGQGAADIGYQEDEKDHGMHAVFAVGVGAQQGADQQHGRAGGAHPACQDGAHGQQESVHHGRAHQRALETHAAGHGEQREQQDDEGDVVQQNDMQKFVQSHIEAVNEETGHQKGQTPEDGDFAEMVFPEVRQGQRHDGDGKQHAGEGNDPDGRELGSGDGGMSRGGQGRAGQNQGREQGRNQGQRQRPEF